MPTVQGSYSGVPVIGQFPGRSTELDEYTVWTAFSSQLADWSRGGSLTNTQPVDELRLPKSGARERAYSDEYYHRVHIIPAILNLGNLLSTQVRTAEVWNAHFVSKLLNAITASGGDGIQVTEPQVPPTTFGPLASRIYSYSISLDGPAVVDAVYTFDFPTEDPTLTLTGRRVIVFSIRPNWEGGWLDRLEWLTEVLPSYEGYEQRVKLRQVPRRRFEFEILADFEEAFYQDVLLQGWQARVYALPVWPDGERLNADLGVGSTAISVTTTDRDFYPGGLAVLYSDHRTTEALEILTVSAGSISLKRPTLAFWPKGARILPVRLARLPNRQALSRVTDGIAKARVHFEVQDNTAAVPSTQAVQLNGLDVYLKPPNRAEDVSVDYLRTIGISDNATGVTAHDDRTLRPDILRGWQFLYNGKAEIAAARAFLEKRAGRYTPFYMPTYEMGLQLIAAIGSSDTVLKVKDMDLALYLNGADWAGAIALRHTNGTWYARTVTAISSGDPGEERISIGSALGIAAQPTDFTRICFLEKVRMEADAAEIAYQTDSLAVASLMFRAVRQ